MLIDRPQLVGFVHLLVAFVASMTLVALNDDAARAEPRDSTMPNIIVILLDDINVHDGQLWSDEARTPELYRRFVSRGISLSNAIVETPLDGPSWATLLTGLHTHNHGVKVNDASLFNPRESLTRELTLQGYESILTGRYFDDVSRMDNQDWAQHESDWTHMDVIVTGGDDDDDYYYDYETRSRNGVVARYEELHSTRFVAERARDRLRQTDPASPIFALIAPFDARPPNTPMPEFENDARCLDIPAWLPPSYNEVDVGDKPSFVASRAPLASIDGWSMVELCKQMLGVDWLVGTIVDELKEQGRLRNTLLILTADNGLSWGEHRIAGEKESPYSVRVPLYMSWPARWGGGGRSISQLVSNVDLAPTLCGLAGCSLGPFPRGIDAADGQNLVPLLDGEVSQLDRDAVLEANYDLAWRAIRTTSRHPLGLWHYIDWGTGERELYDLSADPWEMENLAETPDSAEVSIELAQELGLLRLSGTTSGNPTAVDPDHEAWPHNNIDRLSSSSDEQALNLKVELEGDWRPDGVMWVYLEPSVDGEDPAANPVCNPFAADSAVLIEGSKAYQMNPGATEGDTVNEVEVAVTGNQVSLSLPWADLGTASAVTVSAQTMYAQYPVDVSECHLAIRQDFPGSAPSTPGLVPISPPLSGAGPGAQLQTGLPVDPYMAAGVTFGVLSLAVIMWRFRLRQLRLERQVVFEDDA